MMKSKKTVKFERRYNYQNSVISHARITGEGGAVPLW